MIEWSDEQLDAAQIDPRKLASLVRRLERCGKDMAVMGLHMYGASGHGCLIHNTRPTHSQSGSKADYGSPVAKIPFGHWDGGDW
jgi:hypothetical protein